MLTAGGSQVMQGVMCSHVALGKNVHPGAVVNIKVGQCWAKYLRNM